MTREVTEILEDEDIKLNLSRVHKFTGDKGKSDSFSTIIAHQQFSFFHYIVQSKLRNARAFS